MSKGSIGTKDPKYRKYYNLRIAKKDWCNYFKNDCPMENNIPGSYCWVCKHCEKVDIPHLLAERGRDENYFRAAVSDAK
jgi:hypothetical protein